MSVPASAPSSRAGTLGIERRPVDTTAPAPRQRMLRPADEWAIGVVAMAPEQMLGQSEVVVHWIDPPEPRTFIADPFALDDRSFLCEEFHYPTATARLVRLELDGLRVVDRAVVFEPGHHVSYPFVIDEGDHRFVIPEQAATQRVDLYEWTGGRLAFVSTLIEGVAAFDPTVHRLDSGRWQMCFSTGAGGFSGVDLDVWEADQLTGPWVRRASHRGAAVLRPAGAPFLLDGTLVRPTQDCRTGYGDALLIAPVTAEMSPTEAILRVTSGLGPFPSGPHTLSRFGDRTLVDGKRQRVRADALVGRARRRLRRHRSAPERMPAP